MLCGSYGEKAEADCGRRAEADCSRRAETDCSQCCIKSQYRPKNTTKTGKGGGYIIICIVAATEISILSDKFRPDSPPKILSNFRHSVVLHRSPPKMLSESAQERKKYNILGILQDNIPLPCILPQNVTFNRQAYRQHRHSTAIEHIGSHGIPGAAWARRRPAKTTKKRRQKRRYVKGRPARED